MNSICHSVILAVLCISACLSQIPIALGKTPNYEADIAPVLRQYCLGCHNQDDYDGEFSVESFADLMAGGEEGPVIVPGNPEKSRILRLLRGEMKPKMPPRKEPQPAPEAIATLEAWIKEDAPGPPRAESGTPASLQIPDIQPIGSAKAPVTALAYHPSGSDLLIGSFQEIRSLRHNALWSLGEGKINAIEFGEKGDGFLIGSGIAGVSGRASRWSYPLANQLGEFGMHRDSVYDIALSPDGTLLASAGYDRDIHLWHGTSGEHIRTFSGHNGAVFDLAFHPSGKILASASADETVKIWHVATGERLDTLNQPQEAQTSVAFTHDGQFIIAGGADHRLRLWEMVSLDRPQINPLKHARFAHEEAISKIVVTPDDTLLISAADHATLKAWNLPELTLKQNIETQDSPITSMAVSPNGQRLALGYFDGSIEEKSIHQIRQGTRSVQSATAQRRPLTGEQTEAQKAREVTLPFESSELIERPKASDRFAFQATAGQRWIFEASAGTGSPIDTKVSVFHADGSPVERVRLQAVRDSWFTFRGKDSNTIDDFRVHNWQEMELNEYLFANGEVTRLWLYPRGPDSGFKVYPGFGKRHTFFGTSALAHPLGEPCFIVTPLGRDEAPRANGLPVFPVYFENDDDPSRRRGKDSVLLFTAPESGAYQVAVEDVRGHGGQDYAYAFRARQPDPRFELKVDGANPTIHRGSGREFTLTATRYDGFDGEIAITLEGVPEGFVATSDLVIEAGQSKAKGVIFALAGAKPPEPVSTRFVARARTEDGRRLTEEIEGLGRIELADSPKLQVEILPSDPAQPPGTAQKPLEFTIHPGETITAKVRARRNDFNARIELGGDDSGRNLPHGVYVDNIGLNGLLIVEGETERTFYITAAKWVKPQSRAFHLLAKGDGGQASLPAILHIRQR